MLIKQRSVRRRRRQLESRNIRLENLETRQLMAADLVQLALLDGMTHDMAAEIALPHFEDVSAGIVNGQQTSDFKAVGIVNEGCSVTLISPTHVLTAAHWWRE